MNSKQVCKKLKTVGINVVEYKRSPVRGAGFVCNSTKSKIRVFANDNAEVQIITDKKKCQAVLNVIEKKRKLEIPAKKAIYTLNSKKKCDVLSWLKDTRNPISSPVKGCKRVIVIDKDTLDKEYKLTKKSKVDNYKFSLKFVLYIPETKLSFLMGIDEAAHFISPLPEIVNSVSHAHEILRPKDISDKAKRHGEFFLDPITDKERKDIVFGISKSKFKLRHTRKTYGIKISYTPGYPLEYESSHRALAFMRVNGKSYANIKVFDTRKGRHSSLVLEDWHRVIRNREVVDPFAGRRVTYFD